MISFFDYKQSAGNDASMQWLYQIFGGMDGLIPPVSGMQTSGLAAAMFSFFNTTMLSVAVLIVVYIVVVGTVMTAHEGKFMHKWNSLWTPLRVVLGIVCVMPVYPSYTYSILQHIIMWVVIQGIGAADYLWTSTNNFIQTGEITVSPDVTAPTNIKAIFSALTCEKSAAISNPAAPAMANGSKFNYFCNDNPNAAFCGAQAVNPTSIDPASTNYSFGPNGSCGTLTYCNQTQLCSGSGANSLECAVCQAQIAALPNILNDLRSLAGDLVAKRDLVYQQYYYQSLKADAANKVMPGSQVPPSVPAWIQNYCSLPSININPCTSVGGLPPPQIAQQGPGNDVAENIYFGAFIDNDVYPKINGKDFIGYEANYLAGEISAAANRWWAAQTQNKKPTGAYADAANAGWGLAGGYYYFIANKQIQLYHATSPAWSVSAPDPALAQPSNDMSNYISNYQTASTIMKWTYTLYNGFYPGGPASSGTGGGPAGATFTFGGQAAESMSEISGDLSTAFNNMTTGFTGGSSLTKLQQVGVGLLVSVETLYSLILGLAFGLGIAGTFTGFGLGTGVINPGIGGLSLMYSLFAPAFFALLAWMITLGGTLAVYVPLIPYVIFMFGVLGWIIAVIEAMVAAPLVALGIIAPGGEHEILGKSAPALMLLFSIFLRPSLMVFGLMLGGLVADLMVNILQTTFWSLAVSDIHSWDPLSVMFFLSAFLGLLVLAVNKSFALIHIIPSRVMAWISGQAAYGEEGGEAVQGVRSDVGSGTSAAGGGVQSSSREMGKEGAIGRTGQARKETIEGEQSGLARGSGESIGPKREDGSF